MICCIGGRPIRTPMRNWPVRAHILLPRKLRRDAPAMSGRAPRPRPSVVTVRVQIQIPPSVPGIFLQAIKEAGAMTAAHETGSAEVRSAGQEAYINGNDFAAASLSVQDSCKTPRRTRRYGMDNGFQHTLKTQPLSTRRYPLEPPFSGSSPVAPTICLSFCLDKNGPRSDAISTPLLQQPWRGGRLLSRLRQLQRT